MLRVAGHLQKSTEVMKLVNDTMKLPEMQKAMMEMSKGGGLWGFGEWAAVSLSAN
jgi:hypothetical protein